MELLLGGLEPDGEFGKSQEVNFSVEEVNFSMEEVLVSLAGQTWLFGA